MDPNFILNLVNKSQAYCKIIVFYLIFCVAVQDSYGIWEAAVRASAS